MKVDIVSDLHVEFNGSAYKRILAESTSKKIIIAGDMGPVQMPDVQDAFVWLANKYEEVIYVPGNHDYYGIDIEEGDQILEELEDKLPSLTVLTPYKGAVIGDYIVIGATLWVPDSFELHQRENLINDPFQIRNLYNQVGKLNTLHSQYLYKNTNSKTIVVTHHLPAPQCIAAQYKNQGSNCWFMSNEFKTIVEKEPAMWIFGHSHVRSDFPLSVTRMINNAYGYPTEYRPFKQITYDIG